MSKGNNQYDFIAKVLIIGDSGVGKTCLLLRFCENNFTTSHLATIELQGIDFKLKNVEVDGKKIKMQIWDTAGQERFKTITQTYYKGASGIVLAYSCIDKDSFSNIDTWMKQIKGQASDDVSLLLVGTKCDMQNKAVSYDEGKALADSYGIKFFETSAKNDINVNDALITIAKDIKDKIELKEKTTNPSPGNNNNVQLGKPENTGGKNGGCC